MPALTSRFHIFYSLMYFSVWQMLRIHAHWRAGTTTGLLWITFARACMRPKEATSFYRGWTSVSVLLKGRFLWFPLNICSAFDTRLLQASHCVCINDVIVRSRVEFPQEINLLWNDQWRCRNVKKSPDPCRFTPKSSAPCAILLCVIKLLLHEAKPGVPRAEIKQAWEGNKRESQEDSGELSWTQSPLIILRISFLASQLITCTHRVLSKLIRGCHDSAALTHTCTVLFRPWHCLKRHGTKRERMAAIRKKERKSSYSIRLEFDNESFSVYLFGFLPCVFTWQQSFKSRKKGKRNIDLVQFEYKQMQKEDMWAPTCVNSPWCRHPSTNAVHTGAAWKLVYFIFCKTFKCRQVFSISKKTFLKCQYWVKSLNQSSSPDWGSWAQSKLKRRRERQRRGSKSRNRSWKRGKGK